MRQKYPSFSRTTQLRLALAALLCVAFPAIHVSAHASEIAATRVSLATAPAGAGGATLTATVETATGTPATSGTVDFVLPNGQSLGSAVVNSAGVATLSVSNLPTATTTTVSGGSGLPVAAEYHASSADYSDSISPATELVSPAAATATPDFTITANPTTLNVKQGSYGTTALTATSVGGFTGPVQFSCTGLPAQVTCAFNPNQQTIAANGSIVSTLEISTQAASGTASSALDRHTDLALAMLLPGGLALLALSRRRRFHHVQWLAVAFFVAGTTVGLSGCSQRYGYLHHPPTVATGTPAGTYTITVVADGDELSTVFEHTLAVSLVVQ